MSVPPTGQASSTADDVLDGSQHIALRMAAEGAVAAYEHIVGETWKPYERQVENPGQTVSRQAADLQMAALG